MATFLAVVFGVACLSVASAAPAPQEQHALFLQRPLRQLPPQQSQQQLGRTQEPIAIVRLNSDVSYDGNFVYEYEGANGIRNEAHGALKNVGQDAEAQTITGSFSYVGDDGVTYSISYTADEEGYKPVGDHLPTPPPIPEAIAKALEFIARNPPPPEEPEQRGTVNRPQQQFPSGRIRT